MEEARYDLADKSKVQTREQGHGRPAIKEGESGELARSSQQQRPERLRVQAELLFRPPIPPTLTGRDAWAHTDSSSKHTFVMSPRMALKWSS